MQVMEAPTQQILCATICLTACSATPNSPRTSRLHWVSSKLLCAFNPACDQKYSSIKAHMHHAVTRGTGIKSVGFTFFFHLMFASLQPPVAAPHVPSSGAACLIHRLIDIVLLHAGCSVLTLHCSGEAFTETDQRYLQADSGGNRDDGCTAVTAVIVGSTVVVAHVGDSRAVLAKTGKGESTKPQWCILETAQLLLGIHVPGSHSPCMQHASWRECILAVFSSPE